MYCNVKSTGLPLGLFSTDVFWNHSCLLVCYSSGFYIVRSYMVFCNYRILLELSAAIGIYIYIWGEIRGDWN